MTRRRSCPSCWFSGLEPVDENPYGRLRGTCSVQPDGRRRKGGCKVWAPEPAEERGPERADLAAARQALAG